MSKRIWAPIAVMMLTLSACADATPTQPGAGIDHPTGSDEPILVFSYEGGFVPTEYLYTSVPVFALYGDGTLVVQGAQIEIYPGPALPPMIARTIAENGIQAILRAALDAGLDRDGDYSDLGQMGIADAGTARFELTVDGRTHVVTAYALGMEGTQQTGQPDDVWETRQALQRFQEHLNVLDWLPAGSVGQEGAYVANAARLLVGPYTPDDQLRQDPTDWPLAGSLARFGEPTYLLGDGWRCGEVAGDDWTAVHALAVEANQLTPWVSGGDRYRIVFRPLLPDEHGCDVGA